MRKRVEPSFIGIGAAKSGTTWLSQCLSEHPELFIPDRKEVFFFDAPGGRNYSKGVAWYRKFFKGSKRGQRLGEFTNHYMYSPESVYLIKDHIPEVQILACLRNPVELAYSLYWWRKSNIETGDIPDTFEEALEGDSQFIERGLFYKQLKPYFTEFPTKNIKVLFYGNIKDEPDNVLRDVYKFLSVNIAFLPPSLPRKVNPTQRVRSKSISNFLYGIVKLTKFSKRLNYFIWDILSNVKLAQIYWKLNKKNYKYPAITEEQYNLALNYLIEDIEMLEQLLGKDLSSWKSFDRMPVGQK